MFSGRQAHPMKHALTMLITLLFASGAAGQAIAHDGHDMLVPSPDCIQTILNADTGVQAEDCLTGTATFDTRKGASHDGTPYPVAEVDTERYRMIIHYTGGAFPDAALRHWPLSIELNYGGSGWFSCLLVLVETRSGKIGSGFVQRAGDRCNDGFARWERFSENGNGIYMHSATPFRLVNPLDETDWRAQANAMLFDGKDEEAQRTEMLETANPPLYSSWLPYRELENCAACCAGKIVVMQNMLGTEIDAGIDGGRDYRVLGVVLERDAIAALATSEKIGDRCLAAGLDKATAAAEPSGPDGEDLFIYRDRWLQIRNGLAEACEG